MQAQKRPTQDSHGGSNHVDTADRSAPTSPVDCVAQRTSEMCNERKRQRTDSQAHHGGGTAIELPEQRPLTDLKPLRTSYPNDLYSVGWICAIEPEYVAARAFLDEDHGQPTSVSKNDNNDYTLGRSGDHFIVIAVLPHGEYGTSSAATVARDLLHTFPNVKFGLMVGIGGGAPSSKHDIRLGDIVVSTPCNSHGGVLQYDFGKTVQNKKFHRTAYLDQPPPILRTAVAGLKAHYELNGHRLEEAIHRALEAFPRLRRRYSRPEPDTDRLYRNSLTHPSVSEHEDSPCALVCGDSSDRLISRPQRNEFDDNPTIHFGLIASANQLMKDAVIRDGLVKEMGVLCFEMEAAGLMNHFSCLVVRGICDYADSHKSKIWQGYASMAAAAYAKDLLSRIPSCKIETQIRIEEGFFNIERSVETLLHAQHNHKQKTILNWLSSSDFGSQQNDNFNRREPGTGQWFLRSAEFRAWVEAKKQTLFCPGIPGAGKTTLTSIIVADLASRFHAAKDIGIAYIYCDFRRQGEQKAHDLLSNLLKQLSEHCSSIPAVVDNLYGAYKEKPCRPTLQEILNALHLVAKDFSRVFIVVDALDECNTTDGCRTNFLSELFKLQDRTEVNILATSRFTQDLVHHFKNSATLEIRAHTDDVQKYLAGQMRILPSFVLEDPELQHDIKTAISKAIDGMFLLGPLYIEALTQQPTVGHIREALANLPDRLDSIYEQAMMRIRNQGGNLWKLARKTLSWLVVARRVLSTTEVRNAVAIQPGSSELNMLFIPTIEMIGTVCAGLITIDSQSDTVRLVHYTTQQFFEAVGAHWFLDAETAITKICITYLSFNTFDSGFCEDEDQLVQRLHANPLYEYASCNWGYHAAKASMGEDISILRFLSDNTKICSSTQILSDSDDYCFHNCRYEPTEMSALHIAAYFGLDNTIRCLLEGKHNINEKDSHGRPPLWLAAKEGRSVTVSLLLQNDADPDPKNHEGRTPLWLATKNRHVDVVKELLEAGACPNPKPFGFFDDGSSPLLLAAESGHDSIAQLLIAKGADVNSKDREGATPFSRAILGNHYMFAELLLMNGADTEVQDNRGRTPLLGAVQSQNDVAVGLLLNYGAGVECKDNFGRTPLRLALDSDHEKMVKLLLERNADIMVKADDDWTPLQVVLERKSATMIRMLMEIVRSQIASNVTTVLHHCTRKVNTENIGLMLESCIDLEPKDIRCVVLLAVCYGLEDVLKQLQEKSAESDLKDNHGELLLHLAAAKGYEGIAQLVLEHKAEVDLKDNVGKTPLHRAGLRGWKAIAQRLLEHKTDINLKDNIGETPLHRAATEGYKGIAQLLLEHKVDVNLKDNIGETPLHRAAAKGWKAIAKLLLEHKADVNARDNSGKTPLSLAAIRGHEDIVQLLLEHKANVNQKHEYSRTPLHQAVVKGSEVLLDFS
ncbi:hypothetical protein QQS21_010193 [Conoideocrella luteorostrata]|uniref:Uncharacterized protein n=1 Tax=Conoideocrella luteorostrata TaxID=1105319 RepID=A0AAJ0FPN3_9HYPO|nr:hypothetical protein QQS21_010193 [Conoideocrella luteorostrata]